MRFNWLRTAVKRQNSTSGQMIVLVRRCDSGSNYSRRYGWKGNDSVRFRTWTLMSRPLCPADIQMIPSWPVLKHTDLGGVLVKPDGLKEIICFTL